MASLIQKPFISKNIFWNHNHLNRPEMFAFIEHNYLAVTKVPYKVLLQTSI